MMEFCQWESENPTALQCKTSWNVIETSPVLWHFCWWFWLRFYGGFGWHFMVVLAGICHGGLIGSDGNFNGISLVVYTYPSEKYESAGMMTFPIYGKKCSKPPTSIYHQKHHMVYFILLLLTIINHILTIIYYGYLWLNR